MKRILNLFDHNQKLELLILTIFMMIASFLELIGLGLVLLILNMFLGLDDRLYVTFNEYFLLFFNTEASIELALISILILFTVKFLLLNYSAWIEADFLAKFREKISNRLFKNFLYRDVANLLKKNSSEYLRNFTEEITLSTTFIFSCIRSILDSILLFTFIIFLIFYNFFVTIFIFLFFLCIAISYFVIIKNKLSKWALITLKNKKNRIQYISESFAAIKSIKILSKEFFFLNKFEKENFLLSRVLFKTTFLKSIPRNLFEYILILSVLILFYYLINNNFSNEEIIQLISVYTLASFKIVPLINRILSYTQYLKHSYPSLNKLMIENEQKIFEKKKFYNHIEFKKDIKLKIKNFKYKNNKTILLKNINIELKKNSLIGLIGNSGSGKSSIIDILCGFIKNKHSTLEVDGKIIDHSNVYNWQMLVGYVPQNIIILNQSLRDNILFGSDKKIFNDKILEKLIKKVELEYFSKKSNGLSQIINEDGSNISGGEKQRIGIARALINNPELIILDEATSGLDYDTENNVLRTIKKLKKTAIIVSHRHNTLKSCDKIYMVKNKQVKLIPKKKLKKYFEK